ncbi:MAG: DUF3108 domain-containing protein [Deltaproteobacteria bacterium]|nr:DUF3108 domain-containing protein [Deltaproteobacteria bacterium]
MLLGACLCLCPCVATDGATPRAFVPGETLTFDLRWGYVGAGTAVLSVLPMARLNGSDAYHFELTARTNETIDRIFKIRDRLESYADADMAHSLLFKQEIREGEYRNDRVITFDWKKGRLKCVSDENTPRYRPVMPGTFDLLAAFFYLRLQPVMPSSQLECPITDGKRNVIGKVNILRREKIEVQNKVYDTYVLEPLMDEVEVFNSNEESAIRLWVTADERRLPVRVESRLLLGYFSAELRNTEPLLQDSSKN